MLFLGPKDMAINNYNMVYFSECSLRFFHHVPVGDFCHHLENALLLVDLSLHLITGFKYAKQQYVPREVWFYRYKLHCLQHSLYLKIILSRLGVRVQTSPSLSVFCNFTWSSAVSLYALGVWLEIWGVSSGLEMMAVSGTLSL